MKVENAAVMGVQRFQGKGWERIDIEISKAMDCWNFKLKGC